MHQAVTCANEALRKRIEAVLEMAVSTISSLTELFKTGAPVMHEEDGLEKDAEKGPSGLPLGGEPIESEAPTQNEATSGSSGAVEEV